MRRSRMLARLFLGMTVALTACTKPDTRDAENQALAAEQARVAALDRADLAALDQLIAADLTYIHASGKVDTKASFLDAIRTGQLHYISWQPLSMNVRIEGNTAILSGEYAVRVTDLRVKPDPFNVDIFFLTVYAQRSGRWQQIAWQSTRDVAKTPAS
jgi:hypothetical protein